MGPDVYRAPTLPAEIEPPPRELVYQATNREKEGIQYAWMQVFTLPVILGIGVAVGTGISWLGLVVMIAAGVFAHRFRKKAVSSQGAVLVVEQGELKVYARSGVAPLAILKLRELSDVRLDIKTIERVQEGNSIVAAVRITSTSVAPAVDQARIVLVGRKTKKNPDRLELKLTDEFYAYMDSTEWLGKIRVFLRKHGWVPADERKKEKVRAHPSDE